MSVPPFRFTIALPPDTAYTGLFKALADQMSRYIGLEATEAEQAGDILERLVSERLGRASQTGEPVTISFARPDRRGPVTVEVSGPGVPTDEALGSGAGLVVEHNGRHTKLRLSWRVRD